MPKLAYLDLFSGIGGWALGAYMAGVTVDSHFASEIDPNAKTLYKLRFPGSVQLGDITKIDPAKLLAYCRDTEWVVSSSFPCQSISSAGLRTGVREEDKVSSGLWFEAVRIVKVLKPKIFLIENVGDLALRGLDAVVGTLGELGYDAEWRIISAFDMGAPHLRERLWIMAWPRAAWGGGYCGPLSFKAQRSRYPCGRSSMELAEVGYRDRFYIGMTRDRSVFGDNGRPLGSKMPKGGCLEGGSVFGIPSYIAGLRVEEAGLGKPMADPCSASRRANAGTPAKMVSEGVGLQVAKAGGAGTEHRVPAQGVLQDGKKVLDDPAGVVEGGIAGGSGSPGKLDATFNGEPGADGATGPGVGSPPMADPDTVGRPCAGCGQVQKDPHPGGRNLGRSQPHILEGCWDVKPGLFSVVDGVPFWVGCDGQPVAFPVIAKAVTPKDVRHQLAGYGNAVLPAITWALWRRACSVYPRLLEE